MWSNSSEDVSLIVWTGTSLRTEPSSANSDESAGFAIFLVISFQCVEEEKRVWTSEIRSSWSFTEHFLISAFPLCLQNASNRGLLVTIVLSAELSAKVTEHPCRWEIQKKTPICWDRKGTLFLQWWVNNIQSDPALYHRAPFLLYSDHTPALDFIQEYEHWAGMDAWLFLHSTDVN